MSSACDAYAEPVSPLEVRQVPPASPIEAARTFLATIWDGDVPTEQAIHAALHLVVVAYHDNPPAEAWESPEAAEPPRRPTLDLEAADRFRHLGRTSTSVSGAASAVANIADLTSYLEHAVAIADAGSTDEADYYFLSTYSVWERFARDLSIELYARQFDI